VSSKATSWACVQVHAHVQPNAYADHRSLTSANTRPDRVTDSNPDSDAECCIAALAGAALCVDAARARSEGELVRGHRELLLRVSLVPVLPPGPSGTRAGRVLNCNLSTPTGALASARCISCSPRQGKPSALLTHCACLCFSGPCAARGKGYGHAFTELRACNGFRFTYYERYEELMKEGRSESNARAEATAAAETAVKNAVLPYKARPTPGSWRAGN
jgi:hypothetical protein